MVKLFIAELAKCEHPFLLKEYAARKKTDNWIWKSNTEAERDRIMTNLPIIYRAEEEFICPREPLWEDRYYMTLFPGNKDGCSMSRRGDISNTYIDGLKWVYRYYTGECIDWKWRYSYHYPPLFADLSRCFSDSTMHSSETLTKINGPVSPYVQLAFVLPKSQLELLPLRIHNFLLEKYPHCFPESVGFKWAFCRYFWEAHVDFEDISNPVNYDYLLEQWENELV